MLFESLYALVLVPEEGGSWGWSVAQGNLRITVSGLQVEEQHHQGVEMGELDNKIYVEPGEGGEVEEQVVWRGE